LFTLSYLHLKKEKKQQCDAKKIKKKKQTRTKKMRKELLGNFKKTNNKHSKKNH
jgi:hypothetical protein